MEISEVRPVAHAESWVIAAYAKSEKRGGGTFALVLEAEDNGLVVKLTLSESDFAALINFSGTSPHFPLVHKYAKNQALGRQGNFHAILMENIPDCFPRQAGDVANFINRQLPHKHSPVGLIKTANSILNKELTGYPESLAFALDSLGNYAIKQRLKVELNQRSNWGQRSDGALVMIDLAHSVEELL